MGGGEGGCGEEVWGDRGIEGPLTIVDAMLDSLERLRERYTARGFTREVGGVQSDARGAGVALSALRLTCM